MDSYFAGIAGNILHHYDRSLFGLLATTLALTFFSQTDPVYALICTYMLMPLGAISKPIGSLVFGYLGDRIGLQKTLAIIFIGMSVSTASLIFLPTYNEIGWQASLFLGIVQLLRNFFGAAQTTGTAIFVLDQVKPERKSIVSSLFDASGILGTFLASGATLILHVYGISWRWLFFPSCLNGLIGLLISSRRIVNSNNNLLKSKKDFGLKILLEHKKIVVTIAAVSGFSYANYYIVMTFMNSFLPLVSKVTHIQTISIQTFLLGFDFFLLPVCGYVATQIGKRRLMSYAIFGVVISAIPLFMILNQATILSVCFVRIVFTFFGVCLAAPYHAWAIEICPHEHRYLLGAMGVAIGSRFIGAPIPALSLYLYHKTGWIFAPALPLIFISLLALSVLAPRKKPVALKEEYIGL